MQAIAELAHAFEGLEIGAPQVHENLAVFPLLGADAAGADYLLLDEALERREARVTEVSHAGSVPELAFESVSARKILLVDGDELAGAKQNRIVNLSILVGAGRKVVIPVSCVEQGRWSYRRSSSRDDFGAAGRTLFASARAKKAAQVSRSLRASGTRYSDQGEIWSDVSAKLASFDAASDTGAIGDAYARRGADLDAYAAAFHPAPRQRGAVLAIDGRPAGVELFDSAAAFARYSGKLVRSYAMDALESRGGTIAPCPPQAEVRRFLDALLAASAEAFPALGEGEDIRLTGKGVAGGALAASGRIVHLAGHALEGARARQG